MTSYSSIKTDLRNAGTGVNRVERGETKIREIGNRKSENGKRAPGNLPNRKTLRAPQQTTLSALSAFSAVIPSVSPFHYALSPP